MVPEKSTRSERSRLVRSRSAGLGGFIYLRARFEKTLAIRARAVKLTFRSTWLNYVDLIQTREREGETIRLCCLLSE